MKYVILYIIILLICGLLTTCEHTMRCERRLDRIEKILFPNQHPIEP